MGEKPEITLEADSTAITLQRKFDAPPRRVFEAFTRVAEVERWFKPKGLRITDCGIDLRIGGAWRIDLRGAEGDIHRLSGEYSEIDAPRRLVQTIRSEDAPQTEAVETLTFSEAGDGTLLTSTIVHSSTESRDRHIAKGLEKRAAQLLDRLADHLQFGDAAPLAEDAAPAPRAARPVGRIAAAAAALVVALAGGAYWAARRAPGNDEVAHSMTSAPRVSAFGVVAPVGAVSLRAGMQGSIDMVDCDVGGEVAEGSLCATIDERVHETTRDRAEAAFGLAEERLHLDEAGLENAKAALERDKRAGKRRARGAPDKAQAAFDDAQKRLAQSKETFEQAKTAFQTATADFARARIVSPTGGTILARKAEVGAKTSEGEELFVVAPEDAALRIEAHVADAAALHVGDKASIVVEGLGNRIFAGAIAKIGAPEGADKEAGADLVIIEATDPDHVLKPGMSARVEIETAAPAAQ